MSDARFEDGGEAPLRLRAFDGADLEVVSSLLQDAVLPITEMTWERRKRRFAMLLNRFRWEDAPAARQRQRAFERVQTVLAVEDVLKVSTQGFDRSEDDLVLSVLALTFEPGEDGTGRIVITFSGDGAVALDVETLEVTLRDVTRPYVAPSGKAPDHPE
jgi:hypothetical protein